MISVITPTIRIEGLELVAKALRRQTHTDYEWIIVSPLSITELDRQTDHANYRYVKEPEKDLGDYWSIYKAYNEAIRHAKGDLIITWQDYTYTKPDTLERFWAHYLREPKTIIGAVGNKYEDDTWTVKTWHDPREHSNYGEGAYYQCNYNDIELNLSAWPKQSFYAVGGFDEYLGKYSSLCGLDVLDRLNMIGGWDFKLDQSIKSYSLEHGRLPGWDEYTPFNGAYDKRRAEYIAKPVLDYLK